MFARCCWTRFYIRQGIKLHGKARAACPCCGWTGYDFYPLDVTTFMVPRVFCPNCNCQERHRMLHLYLRRKESALLTMKGRVLHFAPESYVRDIFVSKRGSTWVSTDVASHAIAHLPGQKFAADIQRLPLEKQTFDCILCLHVLEHVADDRMAVRELYRVLKQDGVALIMVPFITGSPKSEDWNEPDPQWFGHYRAYSVQDFKERLAPFRYDEILPSAFLSDEEARRYGIPTDSQILYRCTKRRL